MAVLTGLFQRGSSYYLRVVLPLLHPLQTKYKNGQFVVSLGPLSHRDAVQRGTVQRTGLLYGTNPQGIRLAPSLVYQVDTQARFSGLFLYQAHANPWAFFMGLTKCSI